MVSFLKVPVLICSPLLFFTLSSIAVGDLASSCALHSSSAELYTMAEVCPGKSLLQAYAHTSTWRNAEMPNVASVKDWKPQDFRKRFGEFCICVLCFVFFGCVYICCCKKQPSNNSDDATAAHAERCQEIVQRWAHLVERVCSPAEAEAVVRSGSDVTDLFLRPCHPAMARLAFKEDSDAGDWVVDVGQLVDRVPSDYDPKGIPKYIDAYFSSWQLLMAVLFALAQFWGALAFMYWSLFYMKEELMDCDAYPSSGSYFLFATHACHYTRACLQGFPVLAANMILVLMVRTLLQTRFYYSMLRVGYLVVFQNVPVIYTVWPWAIAFSMLQGGLHFAVKASFEPENIHFIMWLRIVKKFVLPGAIFFLVLFRYADVENMLVSLNHIAELEVTQDQDSSPWLARMKIMSEQVIALDVRHRDVYSDTLADIGRQPGLDDIIQNVVANYEAAKDVWSTQIHRSWGLFRSMWPAALMLDRRLDWKDKDTRSWLQVSSIMVGGSAITSLLSVYCLLASTSHDSWHLVAVNFKSVISTHQVTHTATMLGLLIIVVHAVTVVVLLYYTIRNMFYFSFSQAEIDKAVKNVRRTASLPDWG